MKNIILLIFTANVLIAQHDVDNQGSLFILNNNVGINNNNPNERLSIIGESSSTSPLTNVPFRVFDSEMNTRMTVHNAGTQEWFLNASGVREVGKITFSTPAGFPGIVFFTGSDYSQNRFDLGNRGDYFFLGFNEDQPYNGNAINITKTGKLGIKTTNPVSDLSVNGNIESEELQIKINVADYVFKEDYELMTLEDLNTFIKLNGHLPNIQTQNDVDKNRGFVKTGELMISLMEKIEELTLHIIDLNKRVLELEKKKTKTP